MPVARIHFVNRFFHPDLSATSQILSGIAFGLAARGHAVHVIASRQLYEDADARLPARETVNGVVVDRVSTTRFGRGRVSGRAFDYASFYATAAWKIARQVRRGDIIVTKTDPPMLSVVGTAIGMVRGARRVNWLQDLFPEVAVSVGLGGRGINGALASLAPVRNWSLRHADRNVAIGDAMAAYLRSCGLPGETIRIIPNWADPEIVHPVGPSGLRSEWGLDGKIVVGYSGNLGRAHEIETFIAAIRALNEKGQSDPVARNVVFAFVGSGALRQRLQSEVQAARLENVRFFPYQPLERLAEALAVPDIHLVSLRPDLEGFVVPSKVYGVMAAARPTVFIGAPQGEVAHLVRRHGLGFVVPAEDGEALARAVLELAHDAGMRSRMGANARAAFEGNFTKAISVEAWDVLLRELSCEGRETAAGVASRSSFARK